MKFLGETLHQLIPSILAFDFGQLNVRHPPHIGSSSACRFRNSEDVVTTAAREPA